MNVVDHLMSHSTIVLQDIVLLGSSSNRDLLGDGKQFGEVLVWDVVQLSAVVLWDDESVAFRDRSDVCVHQGREYAAGSVQNATKATIVP